LVNGGFESPPVNVYYDGSDPTVADDVPGWLLTLGAADGSYVLISPETDPLAGGTDLDMAHGPAGGGIQTAQANRPAVTPLLPYKATVTTDNYFAATDVAYWIDWFDAGGSLLSSNGGPLTDLNGAFTYAPYTQLYAIDATAPALAASAGVRFESGNAGYAGLAADHFTFSVVPEPASLVLISWGVVALVGTSRRPRCERG
jgi:hypothetical protein